MNSADFLTKARATISADPQSRLSPKVKQAISDPKCIIDIHAHIFDRKCLSVGYVLLRMLKSKIKDTLGIESLEEDGLLTKSEKEVYDLIKTEERSTESDWEKLETELEDAAELIGPAELFGLDIKAALRVLKQGSMGKVLDHYLENFAVNILDGYTGRPFVNSILMMDLATGWDMHPDKSLSMQIDEIKEISKNRAVLPFLSVDPRRAELSDPNENLYSLFLKAFSDPATSYFGVKCYPSLGYFPSDTRLDPIFQICEEKNIPVLSHCGGETVSTFDKVIKIRNEQGDIDFHIPGSNRTERCRYLNEPDAWIPVLNKYKRLKLNLAHFGGDDFWKNHGQTNHQDVRVKKIIEMMKNPEWNVYTDFSFNVVERDLFKTFKEELETNPDLSLKIMFGTDYWVVLPMGELKPMQEEFLTYMGAHNDHLLNKAPLQYLLFIPPTI